MNDISVSSIFNIDMARSDERDTENVHSLIRSTLLKNTIKPEYEGFLVNFASKEEYAFRLRENKFNVVAKSEGGSIIGVLITFTDNELIENLSTGHLKYEIDLFKNLIFNSEINEFMWLDQIAVSKQFRRKNIGSLMLNKALSTAKLNGIKHAFGALSVDPYFNINSINFIYKNGFKIFKKIEIENVKWAIFHKKI